MVKNIKTVNFDKNKGKLLQVPAEMKKMWYVVRAERKKRIGRTNDKEEREIRESSC